MAKRSTKAKKPSDEQPPLHMIIEKGRLVPAFPFDFERLDSYRNGTKVLVWTAFDGDRPLVRRWWATIGNYIKNTDLPWGDRETASAAIKLALAMVVPFKMPSGTWSQYPRSLNDLDDAELEGKIREMEQLLYDLTGVDVEALRREVGSLGDEPFETNQPANDAGDETLAGKASSPEVGSEESTSAGPDVPTPAGTGATEQPETATEQRANVLSQREGQSSSEPPEQQRDTLGVTAGETAPQSEPASGGPAPVDEVEAREEPSASSTGDLSAEDRVWLKQGAKMMLACLPAHDPESYRVLIVQLKNIRAIMPNGISDAALSKMEVIRLHCTAVCKGEIDLDKTLVARTAMASLAEVEPDKVKVRQ